MLANVEVTLTVQNNSEVEMGDVVDGYAADQAREYQRRQGSMRQMPSTARIWRKPGRRVTVLLQGKVPVHLKFGQIQPDNGQKASRNRTGFPEQGPPRPGRKQPGPGPKVMQHRMGFPGQVRQDLGRRPLPKSCRSIRQRQGRGHQCQSLCQQCGCSQDASGRSHHPGYPGKAKCRECRRETGSDADRSEGEGRTWTARSSQGLRQLRLLQQTPKVPKSPTWPM
jgi:hypothetical protein